MMVFILEQVENIVEKGENTGYQCWLPAFSPFPTMFSKGLLYRAVKSWGCDVKD